MTREKGSQVTADGDRSHTRTTAPMRNAKGLVQIEMTDVRADVAGTTQTDLCIHVGPVHIHLSAMSVNNGADLADALLENAVSRRIRHHDRGQAVAMFLVVFSISLVQTRLHRTEWEY